MTRIIPAKKAFGAAIEADLEGVATDLRRLVAEARENAVHYRGLNGLAAAWNGTASTLEHAVSQVVAAQIETRKWLGTDRPPITEYVNPALVQGIKEVRP